MTLLSSIKNEFKNTPIAASYAVIGIIGIIITIIGVGTSPTIIEMNANQNVVILFNINNLLICIAYYIFASLLGIFFTHFLSKYHSFTATLLSIVVAVLIIFSTYLIINFLPPTPLDNFRLLKVLNIIYWSTVVIFVAFFGTDVIKAIVGTPNEEERDIGNSIGVILVIFFICLAVWGKMVSYGQHTLISALLPEIWQPVPEKTVEHN